MVWTKSQVVTLIREVSLFGLWAVRGVNNLLLVKLYLSILNPSDSTSADLAQDFVVRHQSVIVP